MVAPIASGRRCVRQKEDKSPRPIANAPYLLPEFNTQRTRLRLVNGNVYLVGSEWLTSVKKEPE